jgi:hypothetical protein
MQATLKKSLANTTVTTAAAVAVTSKKVLNARKLPQRLTSPAGIVEQLALLRRFVQTCKFVGCDALSKKFVL